MKRWLLIAYPIAFLACLISRSFGGTVYFLVGERNPIHNDSYVLPLTEPNDIAHARELIEGSNDETIVVARIECEEDCINRDYFNVGKRAWSWHVTEFSAFADITVEILNGWPGFVEGDCSWWIGHTGGYIGFHCYTVVAELGTDTKHWQRDFNSDDDINLKDFADLNSRWSWGDCNNSTGWCDGFDLDRNGTVDYNDIRIFSESWLSPFAANPIWFSCWDCLTQCYGDSNCSGRVDLFDLDAFKHAYPIPVYYGSGGYDPCLDFDRDFDIDYDDLTILQIWHMNYPPSNCSICSETQ